MNLKDESEIAVKEIMISGRNLSGYQRISIEAIIAATKASDLLYGLDAPAGDPRN